MSGDDRRAPIAESQRRQGELEDVSGLPARPDRSSGPTLRAGTFLNHPEVGQSGGRLSARSRLRVDRRSTNSIGICHPIRDPMLRPVWTREAARAAPGRAARSLRPVRGPGPDRPPAGGAVPVGSRPSPPDSRSRLGEPTLTGVSSPCLNVRTPQGRLGFRHEMPSVMGCPGLRMGYGGSVGCLKPPNPQGAPVSDIEGRAGDGVGRRGRGVPDCSRRAPVQEESVHRARPRARILQGRLEGARGI